MPMTVAPTGARPVNGLFVAAGTASPGEALAIFGELIAICGL